MTYFIQDSLNLLEINSTNGSVYLLKNSSLSRKKQNLQVNLIAQDKGMPPLNKTINFTIYLNYDRSEIPPDVIKQIELDLSISSIYKMDEKIFEFNNLNSFKQSNMVEFGEDQIRTKNQNNTFQNVSNSVLIVILMIVLVFMLLIACFIFVTIYKKFWNKDDNFCRHKNKKNTDSSFSFTVKSSSAISNNSTCEFGSKTNNCESSSAQRFKCIDQVSFCTK